MSVPQGFLLSGIRFEVKGKNWGMGLICCQDYAQAVGVFTTNVNCSYSVKVSKEHIKNKIKAVVVNSGNANCFTHSQGVEDTKFVCRQLAEKLGCEERNILILSTGVIRKRLSYKEMVKRLPLVIKSLEKEEMRFANSILTTDTFEKVSCRRLIVEGGEVRILGIAKGAGMVSPDLATMLAFVLTDARISKRWLKRIVAEVVEKSFNSICVDGCMSTNDSVLFLTSELSAAIKEQEIDKFKCALEEVCKDLAKMIVKDGEGSTKLVQIRVKGAKDEKEAKAAVRSVSSSSLFRSAIYGGNPNWGRIIAALGAVGIKLQEDKFRVRVSSLKKKEVDVVIELGRGKSEWQGWCCDLTPEYVKINAEYS